MRWLRLAALAALMTVLLPTSAQAVVVSRLQLDHPALGTAGGSSLHTAINNIYLKVGNSIDSRYYEIDDIANAATVDLEHNFKSAFSTLTFDVYSWNSGTGELTLLTTLTTPTRAQIALSATPSFTTTKTRVTNNSGATRDLVVVIHHNALDLDELIDVDITSPATGQTITYNSGTGTWVNGFASGGGGGGGGGASWFSPSGTGAIISEENGQAVYLFPDATDSNLVLYFQVPEGYIAGNPITMGAGAYTPSTSNGFVLAVTACLIRQGVDAITSTTNCETDTDAVTNASPANTFQTLDLDIDDGTGEFNSVAASARDMVRITLTRDYANGSDTDTADIRFVTGATTLRTTP